MHLTLPRAFAAACALFCLVPRGFAQSGPFLPGMDRMDATMTTLMTRYDVPGAQLAVLRNGRLVLARGYGHADRDAGLAVQPDAVFRIASLSKFITAIAIMTLVEEGRLDLDAPAFALLPNLTPLPGATVDARLQNITVRQLLQHTGGWDRDVSGDPMFNSTAIATAAGVSAPASAETVIRYVMGRPLDFDPGSRYVYSNLGYNVLGRIIERITGQTYAAYVRNAVFARAGVARAVLGRSLPADRAAGEVRYYDYANAPLAFSVFPPTSARVPWPYGGFHTEAMDAHGGWVMNAIDYVRLFSALDGTKGTPILRGTSVATLTARPAPPVSVGAAAYYGMGLLIRPNNNAAGTAANWWHDGSLPGTVTYAVRLANGWSWAAFFNTRPQAGSFALDIDVSINNALAGISAPPGDLFTSAAPQLLAAPSAQSASPGASATFSVSVSSTTSHTLQWFKDGVAIAGAFGTTLTVSNVSTASAGSYHVAATNVFGTTTSAPVPLVVATPAAGAGRIINLSILTSLTGSTDRFTMGYVVGGSGTSGAKPLVIRAAGPSLAALGVPGTLDDPRLELFAGSVKTGENNDWAGAAAISAAMSGVGAFPYAGPASKDAAVVASIATRDNSVQVSGTGAGAVIAEIYDGTPAALFTTVTPRLVNVSVLKPLGSLLTAGFVLGGGAPTRVLVRAVGPTLGVFGLPGVVADPQLVLFRGSTQIGANNDWGGGTELGATFTQIGAFPLPGNSKDAALMLTLEPGSYSVQVTGVGNTTGVGLVEIYEVP